MRYYNDKDDDRPFLIEGVTEKQADRNIRRIILVNKMIRMKKIRMNEIEKESID